MILIYVQSEMINMVAVTFLLKLLGRDYVVKRQFMELHTKYSIQLVLNRHSAFLHDNKIEEHPRGSYDLYDTSLDRTLQLKAEPTQQTIEKLEGCTSSPT